MARHKVEITGVNTANIKVLSNEETRALLKKMKEGDRFAREELINGNLKLVLSILKRFNHRGENMDDLFQVGSGEKLQKISCQSEVVFDPRISAFFQCIIVRIAIQRI